MISQAGWNEPSAAGLLIGGCTMVFSGRTMSTAWNRPSFLTTRGSKVRSEEHTSELQSLMRISYAVFCLKKKKNHNRQCIAIFITLKTHVIYILISSTYMYYITYAEINLQQ